MNNNFIRWGRRSAALTLLVAACQAAAGTQASPSNDLWVARFSDLKPGPLPTEFEERTFHNVKNKTVYQLVAGESGTVLKAESANSASALIRQIRVDPQLFPVLEWSWKIGRALPGDRWGSKDGDDFSARIFVIFEKESGAASLVRSLFRGMAGALPGRSLNYVWAGVRSIGAEEIQGVSSPYGKQIFMLPARQGSDQVGVWEVERRNVLEDYRRAFGSAPPTIVGIGIMTDTDNSKSHTSAFYGDIRFLSAAALNH